jgi:vancomycin resistance protein YoaR
LLSLLLAAATALSVLALTYDRVYPNLSAFGVPLAGLTREEAAAALSEKLVSVYDNASVTLTLDGNEGTVTAEEAGVSLTSVKTANAAFDAGRQGGVFARLAFAASSLFTERNVEQESDFGINRDAVRNIVSALSAPLAKDPVEYGWTVGKQSVGVSGGSPGARSDIEAMTDAVVAAFRDRNYQKLAFTSESIPPAPFPLDELFAEIRTEPAPAYAVLDGSKTVKLMPHVNGVTFDKENVRRRLAEHPGEPFTIPLLTSVPSPTLSELQESLFRDLLGGYASYTETSSENRVNNIVRTAELINGVVLLPGDSFSFNGVVGQRTEARGFMTAGAYINGQLTEDVGGGICQSSSTLYNAAVLANLNIVSRRGHSMTVSYVPYGRDATVDYGNIDFVFENDTGYPVRIELTHINSTLTARIYGTKTDDLTVSVEVEELSVTPHDTLTEVNPALPPGAKTIKQDGRDGRVTQSYRVLTDPHGTVVLRTPEAKTTYRKMDHIVEVGPGSPSDLPGINRIKEGETEDGL